MSYNNWNNEGVERLLLTLVIVTLVMTVGYGWVHEIWKLFVKLSLR